VKLYVDNIFTVITHFDIIYLDIPIWGATDAHLLCFPLQGTPEGHQCKMFSDVVYSADKPRIYIYINQGRKCIHGIYWHD
jgi:hypothetical protein